jgi:hypothetical protein
MPTLIETEQLLRRLITAPDGVAAALAADADRGGELAAALARTVAPGGRLEAVGRLEIYANMYFYRLLDVLKDDYPATAAVLGETAFHNLITDYLLHHPPAHFSIGQAGNQLPEFLARHPSSEAVPFAGELAAFERALGDAVDATDAPLLGAEQLRGLSPEAWADLHLTLHPSVRLLRCEWPVHVIRERVDQQASAGRIDAAPTNLCVWRHDMLVLWRPLPEEEWLALTALGEGASFAFACEAAALALGDSTASAVLATAFAGWLEHGLLSRAG